MCLAHSIVGGSEGIRFCTSKECGMKGSEWVSAQGGVHMAAALAGYRTALV